MCLFTCPDNASLKCKNTITDGGGTAPQWYHQKYCHHHHHWKRAHIFRWVWPLLEKLPFPICPNGSPCRLDLRWWWTKFLVHFWTIWPLFVCPETFVQGLFIVFTCIAIGQSVSRQQSQWPSCLSIFEQFLPGPLFVCPETFYPFLPALPLAKVSLVNDPNDKLTGGRDHRTTLWTHLVWIWINVQCYHVELGDDNKHN